MIGTDAGQTAVAPGTLRRTWTENGRRYFHYSSDEEVTLWDLRTKQARAEPAGTGGWRVTLDVTARKVTVDGIGAETEVPMDDWVEVGVFADDEPLYLEKHKVRSGAQSITVTVPRKPSSAEIDPYDLLLDRDSQDNAREVE